MKELFWDSHIKDVISEYFEHLETRSAVASVWTDLGVKLVYSCGMNIL